MKSDLPNKLSFWLIPTEAESKAWKQTIEELARAYSGPVFDPHVTVFWGVFKNISNIDDVLKAVFADAKPLTLYPTGLDFKAQLTKNCFVQFDPHETLTQWSYRLKEISGPGSEYELNPHMSLFYGQLTEVQKTSILSQVKVPKQIQFDVVSVVETKFHIMSADEAKTWAQTHRYPLSK